MHATESRTLGQFGTVEEAYRAQSGKRHRKSAAPPRMGETSIGGSVPTEAQRAKRARIDAQQKTTPKRTRKGRARWAQLVGISRDHLYGITVKVTGISAETYWLPYRQAETLYYEITGLDLADAVTEL